MVDNLDDVTKKSTERWFVMKCVGLEIYIRSEDKYMTLAPKGHEIPVSDKYTNIRCPTCAHAYVKYEKAGMIRLREEKK